MITLIFIMFLVIVALSMFLFESKKDLKITKNKNADMKLFFDDVMNDNLKASEAVHLYHSYLSNVNKGIIVLGPGIDEKFNSNLINYFIEKMKLSEPRESYLELKTISMPDFEIVCMDVVYKNLFSEISDSVNSKYFFDNSEMIQEIFEIVCDTIATLNCDIITLTKGLEEYSSMRVSEFQLDSGKIARSTLQETKVDL